MGAPVAHGRKRNGCFYAEDCWWSGAGAVALLTEPIERYLCGKSGVSAADESWRLYRYLKELAGIRYPVECEHPNVERALLREGDGLLVVLVNHSAAPNEVELAVDSAIAGLDGLDGRPYHVAEGRCRVVLGANGGIVLRAQAG